MRLTNLSEESTEYVSAREELRRAEIDLMRHRERVAELRRRLPLGPVVEDYVFEEGPADLAAGDEPVRRVRLSELFGAPAGAQGGAGAEGALDGTRDLVLYHFMYGKRQTEACPMCTMWIDGFNGVAHHIGQKVAFAVVAAADLPVLRAHARTRHPQWTNLRLLSAGPGTGPGTFKYDLGSEDAEGNQDSTVSVFTRDDEGAVRHFYSAHPRMDDDIQQRGIDLLCPVWHVLDLTPGGRGEWLAELSY